MNKFCPIGQRRSWLASGARGGDYVELRERSPRLLDSPLSPSLLVWETRAQSESEWAYSSVASSSALVRLASRPLR